MVIVKRYRKEGFLMNKMKGAPEEMGMTDNQWKDNLRGQLENWEDVEELLKDGKTEEALKKIERVKRRINKGLED